MTYVLMIHCQIVHNLTIGRLIARIILQSESLSTVKRSDDLSNEHWPNEEYRSVNAAEQTISKVVQMERQAVRLVPHLNSVGSLCGNLQ